MIYTQVVYSCRKGSNSIADHLKLVEDRCQEKEKCEIVANRETFGYKECPDADDADMKLWLTYSCDGGGNDLTITRNPICDQIKSTPQTTPTTPATPAATTTPTTTQTTPTTPQTTPTPPTTPQTQPTPATTPQTQATTQPSCVPVPGQTGFMVRLEIQSKEGPVEHITEELMMVMDKFYSDLCIHVTTSGSFMMPNRLPWHQMLIVVHF